MLCVDVSANLSRSGKTKPNFNHTIKLQLDTLIISKIQRALCPPTPATFCASTLMSTLKALNMQLGLNFLCRPDFVLNLTQKCTSMCTAVQFGRRSNKAAVTIINSNIRTNIYILVYSLIKFDTVI